jgi:protease I
VLVAGATTELLSLAAGEIQSVNHDVEPAGAFGVDRVVSQAAPADYDALILPGGTTNPDHLRQDSAAAAFAREFVDSGKPVGVICHGPWILVEADVVKGRMLTSWPSVRTDIRNAGGIVVDEEVVTDGNLTSSRNPDDGRPGGHRGRARRDRHHRRPHGRHRGGPAPAQDGGGRTADGRLFKHAREGTLMLRICRDSDGPGVELVTIGTGPRHDPGRPARRPGGPAAQSPADWGGLIRPISGRPSAVTATRPPARMRW